MKTFICWLLGCRFRCFQYGHRLTVICVRCGCIHHVRLDIDGK